MRWIGTISLLVVVALLLPAAALGADDGPAIKRVAAGLHDGHAFGPRLKADGSWIAYGVRESVKGTFKTSYYARSLTESGLFRSVWPNKHPALTGQEGTASFTDLIGYEWGLTDKSGAMVAQHKTKGAEVLVEGINVRVGGPGAQYSPAMSPDNSRLVVVSESQDGGATDLFVADTGTDGDTGFQLTFTDDSELSPAWHPSKARIVHEVRNPLGADIYVFDLDSFEHTPILRLGTSDEIQPTYSPDGKRIAFLSNKDSRDGLRWDLFVFTPGAALPQPVIKGVRRSEKSRGYCWDPLGRYLIASVEDELAGYPLVIAPSNGSEPARVLATTRDNMDPTITAVGQRALLAWVAMDTEPRPSGAQYRVVYVADFGLLGYGDAAGLQAQTPTVGTEPATPASK